MKIKPLELYMGPCVLEGHDFALDIASELKRVVDKFQGRIHLTFKGSFDKANRTSVDSYRGPGLEEGMRILQAVKERFKLPVLTDFHTPDQAQVLCEVIDVLQVPAFLCRQTDMIIAGAKACAEFDRILKVKKGQFLAPHDMQQVVNKAKHFLPLNKILLTERGSSFGYNNLIIDMSSFFVMKSFGVDVVHDATHSVQRPGGLGTSTGGARPLMPTLTRAALAAGANGLFMEVHPEPARAKSDATTAVPLSAVEDLLTDFLPFYELAQKNAAVVLA